MAGLAALPGLKPVRVEVRAGSFLRLWGPLRFRVARGSLDAGGFEVAEGFEALVQSERGVSLYSECGAVVEIIRGGGGGFEVIEHSGLRSVWSSWKRVLEGLPEAGSVALLGPVESGKSTLSAWIVSRGGCYASLDPGQSELGTPCFYSAARIEQPVLTVAGLDPDWSWLVGCNAPEYCHWASISAAARAARLLRSRCRLIVYDTDGFVSHAGVAHKQSLLETLEPDTVIVFEAGPWRGLVEAARASGAVVYTVPPVPREVAVRRRRVDRRVYRERMYARLFSKPATMELDARETPVSPTAPGGQKPPARLLAGITLEEGWDLPALLRDYGPRIHLDATREPPARPTALRLGYTRVSEEWREERLPLKPYTPPEPPT